MPSRYQRSYQRSTKSKRKSRKKKTEFDFIFNTKLSDKQIKGVLIVVLFVFCGIGLLSMFNLAGRLGRFLFPFLKQGFGFEAYLIPFILGGLAYALLKEERDDDFKLKRANLIGLLLFILGLASIFHLFYPLEEIKEIAYQGKGGGLLGYGITFPLLIFTGFWATFIISLSLFFLGIILAFNLSFKEILEITKKTEEGIVKFAKLLFKKLFPKEEMKISGLERTTSDKSKTKDLKEKKEVFSRKPLIDFKIRTLKDSFSSKKQKPVVLESKDYKPFPLDLLESKSSLPTSGDIKNNVKIIQHTLRNFGIEVEMGEVNIGPTVTQYTFKPAEGIKLSRITALQNDLALALAAHPIRIEAPIPGRSLVGIEVPNKSSSIVRLRGLLEDEEFSKRKSNLTIVLGRSVAGLPVLTSLEKLPHLLISGATGSGKSVCLNSIILTLLYQNSPRDLRLILVDPKKVEMTYYNQVPHLLSPVITEVDKTINALRWLITEMERRFRLFSETGKRDISTYNASFKENKLPVIVLIIDELADLMASAAAEVEGCIVRLAQMARAVGIHLILATQRPSVNVITGLIKANITARIAFAVASLVDSRTIIDMSGAEKLLGNGDMLYVHSDLGKPKRIQGAFVSEGEIKRVCEWFGKQGRPNFNKEVLEKQASSSLGLFQKDVQDELFEEAKDVVIQAQKASASLLQRRLRIGYARAARLLDILEEKGIVGPAEGAKPREVLIGKKEDVGLDKEGEENKEGVEENKERGEEI